MSGIESFFRSFISGTIKNRSLGNTSPDPSVVNLGIPGIDISHHNGIVNFSEAKQQGIRFVIMKMTEGYNFFDPKFEYNYAEAVKNGMLVIPYHFVRPSVKVKSQTETITKALETKEIDGFMLDCEVTDGQNSQVITDCIWALGSKFRERAPIQLAYTRASWWNPYVKRSTNWSKLMDLHIAHWGVKKPTLPLDWNDWLVWQQGIVKTKFGVAGDVDYNVWNPKFPFPKDNPEPIPEPGTKKVFTLIVKSGSAKYFREVELEKK